MAFKVVNQSVIDIDTDGATKIESATGKDIVLYPADNIWIKQGTKLIFEGTTPDDYEAKLQATTVTADRDLILPDESGTIATQAYVTSAVSGGSLANTDSLAEGTSNLYYTDARADLRIASANLSDLADVDDSARADTYVLTWENATSTWIAAPTASTYDTADFNTDLATALGGNVTIGGNLTVSGTTTTVNSNTVNIGDAIITLNADETGTPSQNAGIEIERGTEANVFIRYNESTNVWEFTNDGSAYTAFGSSSTFTGNTDGISEGSTNLYYTDTRFDTRLGTKTTADLTEGTNLYYTDARARAAISEGSTQLSYNSSTGVMTFTQGNTDTVSEGSTNLYYTDARVDSHLSGGTGVTYASGAISIGQAVGTSNHVQFHCIGVGTPASTNAGEIRATADITAYYSSDEKLKENVVEINEAINKVKQIRGVEFDWSQEYLDAKGGEDNYFVRKHDVGVIAQEIETVLPEVVGTREDGTKAVKYDRIVALLIQAIKEQQSEIDDLKSQIDSIQGE